MTEAHAQQSSGAIRLIQAYIWVLFLIPAALRVAPLGGVGSPVVIFGVCLLIVWAVTVLTPSLSMQERCGPVRAVLAVFVVTVLISYAVMHWSPIAADIARSSDRFVITTLSFSGVALFAAEAIRTKEEILRVLRTFISGAAVMSTIALMQSRLHFDLTRYIFKLPGLSMYEPLDLVTARAGQARPAGTASHAIEFGVVVALALGFAIHCVLYDREWPKSRRWAVLVLVALGIPASVSRSAILVAAVVLISLLVGTTNAIRVRAVPIMCAFLVSVFVAFPGLLGTLTALVGAGTSDPSIAGRVNDYPFVTESVQASPWLGHGPGYLLTRIRILDNQYLLTLVELGLVGLIALSILWGAIAVLGRGGRKRLTDEGDRLLGQMFAGAAMGALAAAFTFDALSFRMFTAVVALLLGLSGRYWCIARQDEREAEQVISVGPTAAAGCAVSPARPLLTAR